MKRFLTLLFVLASGMTMAQRSYGIFDKKDIVDPVSSINRDIIDTLKPLSFVPADKGGLGCFTGIYNAPDSGYVTGNNKYGDLKKAQFFSLSKMGAGDTGTIQSLLVNFGLKTLSTTPGSIYAEVYDVDTAGFRPWHVLATTNPVSLTEVTADGFPTAFTFTSPFAVSDSFFVSVTLPVIGGDTVAITSSNDECRQYSGWSWEQWSDGTWHSILNSWILDIDLAIYPVIDLPINTGSGMIGLLVEPANLFPNPSSASTELTYTVTEKRKVEIFMQDYLGRIVWHIDNGTLNPGSYRESIGTENFPAGLYYVLVRSGGNIGGIPLVIQH